jgi:dihydrofolate reductase
VRRPGRRAGLASTLASWQADTVQVSVYVATSVDGLIARPDGSLDWLPGADGGEAAAGEDYGYAAFMASVDVLVMGRASYETVIGFGAWPYEGKRVVVLSAGWAALPEGAPAGVELSTETPEALCARLEAEGAAHVYVDGGRTIQGFLRAGRVDRITITMVPVVLGRGRRLFGELDADLHLALESSRGYPSGLVQTTWRVAGRDRGTAIPDASESLSG